MTAELSRFDASQGPKKVGPNDGHYAELGGCDTKNGTLDPEELGARYGIEFDLESLPRICAEHGLVHPLLEG